MKSNIKKKSDGIYQFSLEDKKPIPDFMFELYEKAVKSSLQFESQFDPSAAMKVTHREPVILELSEKETLFEAILLRSKMKWSEGRDDEYDKLAEYLNLDANNFFKLIESIQQRVSSRDVHDYGEKIVSERPSKRNKTEFQKAKKNGFEIFYDKQDGFVCSVCPHYKTKNNAKDVFEKINLDKLGPEEIASFARKMKCFDCGAFSPYFTSIEKIATGLFNSAAIGAPVHVIVLYTFLMMISDYDFIKIVMDIKSNFKITDRKKFEALYGNDFEVWANSFFNNPLNKSARYPVECFSQKNCVYHHYLEKDYKKLFDFGISARAFFLNPKEKEGSVSEGAIDFKISDDSIPFDDFINNSKLIKKRELSMLEFSIENCQIPLDFIHKYLGRSKSLPFYFGGIASLRNLIELSSNDSKLDTNDELSKILQASLMRYELLNVFTKKPEKFTEILSDPLAFWGELLYLREFSMFLSTRKV